MKRIRAAAGKLLDLLGRLRLMTTLTVIVLIAMILFSSSLFMSNSIAKGLIHSEYEEYNATIFRQAENAISRSIYDLTQLCYTFMSNSTVVEYFEAPSFKERTVIMDSL